MKTRLCPVLSDDSSRRPTGPQSASIFAVAGISLENATPADNREDVSTMNGSVANLSRNGELSAMVGERGRGVNDFKGRHFGGETVLWAVRWYCRYAVSYRDLESMMTVRGDRGHGMATGPSGQRRSLSRPPDSARPPRVVGEFATEPLQVQFVAGLWYSTMQPDRGPLARVLKEHRPVFGCMRGRLQRAVREGAHHERTERTRLGHP